VQPARCFGQASRRRWFNLPCLGGLCGRPAPVHDPQPWKPGDLYLTTEDLPVGRTTRTPSTGPIPGRLARHNVGPHREALVPPGTRPGPKALPPAESTTRRMEGKKKKNRDELHIVPQTRCLPRPTTTPGPPSVPPTCPAASHDHRRTSGWPTPRSPLLGRASKPGPDDRAPNCAGKSALRHGSRAITAYPVARPSIQPSPLPRSSHSGPERRADYVPTDVPTNVPGERSRRRGPP